VNLAGLFAVTFTALYAAHHVADMWVQTHCQAQTKGLPGWRGRLACAAHVATYTLTAWVALTVAYWATDTWPSGAAVWVGLAVSAVSHYVADRRDPLRRIADALGSGPFYRVNDGGISGAYLLDQSWHIGFLFIAALVITRGSAL
jgi:hypothetical protein